MARKESLQYCGCGFLSSYTRGDATGTRKEKTPVDPLIRVIGDRSLPLMSHLAGAVNRLRLISCSCHNSQDSWCALLQPDMRLEGRIDILTDSALRRRDQLRRHGEGGQDPGTVTPEAALGGRRPSKVKKDSDAVPDTGT